MALKRWLLILGGVLTFGGMVNVAVAWACAAWHYVGRAPRIAVGSTLEDGTTPWNAAMYRSSLAHRMHSVWGPLATTPESAEWRGIEVSPYSQFGREALLHRFRVMPLGIIRLGFAGNTALFAAMAGLLLIAFYYSRRVIRAGAGRCPGCAYEIRNTGRDQCPECGGIVRLSRIGSPAARLLRRGVLLGWCTLLLAVIVAGGAKSWPWISGHNWDAYKPSWWLIAKAKSLDASKSTSALDELITRLKDDKLADDVVDSLVLDALAIQADVKHLWVHQWGDIVTTARSKGLVNDDAWRTFARQAVGPELIARPAIVEGDVIAAKFVLHMRTSSDRALVAYLEHAESALGDRTFRMRYKTTTELRLDPGGPGRVGLPSFIDFDFNGRGRFAFSQLRGLVADVEPGDYILESTWHVVISEALDSGGRGGVHDCRRTLQRNGRRPDHGHRPPDGF